MGTGTLVVRADAEQRMGTGHIMRCIALAQGWQETGGPIIFCISPGSRPLEDRIVTEGFSVKHIDGLPGSASDAGQTLAVACEAGATWIVVDGYQFGDEYTGRLRHDGLKVLAIDDYGHAGHYAAAIVLNQNVYASRDLYPPGSQAKFLLGGKYTLLRKEFRDTKDSSGRKDPSGPVRNILVTMGGSDPDNVTGCVLDILAPLAGESGLSVTAVIGRMNAFLVPGRKPAGTSGNITITYAGEEMPRLIRGADIMITGAGTTAWETAYLGIPMIAVVLSQNQERVALALKDAGGAFPIHDRADIPQHLEAAVRRLMDSAAERRRLAASAESLIDGEGVYRVIMEMQAAPVRLRKAQAKDSSLLLSWANDPVVRRSAFSQETIDPTTHEQWFAKKLQSRDSWIYIAVDAQEVPVGQVRFDRDGDTCEVDLSVSATERGRGLGAYILALGTAKTFHSTNIKTITARVKTGNTASRKAFEKAGFILSGTAEVRGSDVWQMVCRRPGIRAGDTDP